MLKYSRQREAIKECLMNRKDHPTADMVYDSVREEYPQISLGTVYRNLSLLVELGEAMKIACNDGIDHFDACVEPHLHFYCNQCSSMIDVEIEDKKRITKLEKAVSESFKGNIMGSSIMFYGACEKCSKEK